MTHTPPPPACYCCGRTAAALLDAPDGVFCAGCSGHRGSRPCSVAADDGRLEIIQPASGPDWRGHRLAAGPRAGELLDVVDTGRTVESWTGVEEPVLSVSRQACHWLVDAGQLAASHADIDAACDARPVPGVADGRWSLTGVPGVQALMDGLDGLS